MNIKKLMTGAFALALAALALPAWADLPRPDPTIAEFARGIKFTVAGYQGGTEVQTNFPVLVRLSTAITGFDYGDFYNDGSLDSDGDGQPNLELIDIGFVDVDGNGLAYDIDTWNTNDESLVWVNLPRMTNGAEFAMWYRSTKTGKTLNPDNVWTNYAGVWHFREDYGTETASVSVYDSTTNQLTGSTIYTAGQDGGQQPATLAAGKLGRVRRMGNNYHNSNKGKGGIDVILGDSAKRDAVDKLTPAFSGSFWMYGENTFRYPYYVSRKKTDAASAWGFQSRDDKKASATDFGFWSKTGGNDNKYRPTLATSVSQKTWAKIDFVYTAEGTKGKGYLYKNGVPVNNVSVNLYEYAFDGDADLYIGGGSGSDSRPLIGLMDEVRLCYSVPTPTRVKADFDTVDNASFLTRGTVVTNAITERPVVNFTVTDVGASHIQFGGNLFSLGSDQATVCAFYAKVWPTASSEPATWTALGTGLGTGAFFGLVKGLAPATAHSFKLKVTNDEGDDGVDSDETDGTFTTSGVGVSGTGGDVTRVGDDWIHYFRVGIDEENGGTLDAYAFTPPSYASTVRALVVAGGGPGGYRAGGGGGAGGYIYNTALAVSPGTEYAIHVGTGGSASESDSSFGEQGGNSSVIGGSVNLVAVGGGAGGNGNRSTADWRVGQSGGSGGGSSYTADAGTAISGQGHAGGKGATGDKDTSLFFGGGGGGAGSAGDDAITTGNNVNAPNGGSGLECDITGVGLFYAGGGGAGSDELSGKPGSSGAGGSGVGGTGSRKSSGVASAATQGVDGTGSGGGGGCGDDPNFYKGGDGGDGIVIIRYASQGDPSTVPEPIVSLQSAVYDETSENCEVSFRVAWGGYDAQAEKGYEDADVLAVWGFRKGELTHTNSLAAGVIGRGTATFRLGEQTKTVYVRVLVTNAVTGALSPEIVKIPFLNPAAPMATVSVTATAQTTAAFAANVTSLGDNATSVSGVFQVCADEDFREGTYLTFPASGTLTEAGTLTGSASELTYNTPYFVRASLTNNIPEFFETDPVEFRTKGLGSPSGSVQNNETYPVQAGSTTITAMGYLFSPGTGATAATIRLEASTTEDFAAIAAYSDDATGLGEREYATLTITGLEPETAYYLRLRMENEGHMVQRSSIVGPFTTLRPIVNLTIPDLASYHVTLVSVTTNDVAVAGNAGVYTVFSNATVVATFAAEPGYRLVGGATVDVVMDANKTLTGIPTAELIPPPPPTVTLTIPDLASYHMTLVSVTTNDVEVVGNAGVYTVFSNATVVATFAAEPGYLLEGDAAVSVVMDANKTFTTADMPTAEFITEASAPEVSQSATKVSARKTITLMATAAGATSYIWLKNGVQIEGGTSGTLTVNWRKPNGNPIDTYQAVAVYSINDLPVESEPSARMTVENLPMGTIILVVAAPPAPPAEHDYSADYLTFRVLTSGTISWKAIGSNSTKTIDYSIDNGAWISITSTSEGATISVTQGNLVRFRGSNNVYATDKNTYSGFEGGTATYDIEGNIMSLLYGDNFAENTALPNNNYIFCSLFKKAPVISAEHLILPATMLKDYCYRALFSWCETLTKAPALPATTLATGCYWYMFEHCAITEAPVLNATTLVNECYGHMFTDCGLLNSITCLATSGFNTSNCLADWVKNVAGDGTFVKAASASSWTTGTSGMPSGWLVCEDVLLLPPEVAFDGETIELECDTTGAEIHYRLGQTGDFALYTQPISIVADTVVEAYSTYQSHTSQTITQTCVYFHETPFQRSNKDLATWRYGGNTITTPYSVNGIDGHSGNYSKGTFTFDTSVTLKTAQPTYLWFQHADQSADIYVDNVKVGTHWGGYNAFFFDISDYVHRGKNDIRVALCNNRGSSLAPAAGDFNFNATLGNVKLFTSPVLPAMKYGYDGFHITSTVSASSATTNATINVETEVPAGASLKCIISDDSYAWTNTVASEGRAQTFTTTIAGSDLKLWNGTKNPHLYTVTLEIYKDGELYHRYQRPYGFRYYEYVINETVNGETYTGFLLNGEPYLLRGVCMHDDVEGKANALTDSDYDQEFAIIRELGCNFIRLAHYPHPKEVYDRCDRLGIVVQTEVPCVNKLQSTMPEDYYTHLTTQYIEMVQQHYNHPCIMFWGLSNETTTDDKAFGKEKIEEYCNLIKSMDTERMVGYVMSHSYDDPSGYYNNPNVDWFGCNLYVGWYIDKTINNPSSRLNTRITKTITNHSKPLALSEYGCGGTQHCHSTNFLSTTTSGNNPRHDIEYQMWLHEGHIAAIRNFPQLLFTGQWQLFDIAVSSRKEGYTECLDGETATTNEDLKYLNNKGLVERDHRTKKDTFYLYKAEWNSTDKFVHICGKDYTKTTQRKLKCYTNDGDTLAMYIGDSETPSQTATVVNHIAEFEETDFTPGVEIRVEGANSSDTVTFQ